MIWSEKNIINNVRNYVYEHNNTYVWHLMNVYKLLAIKYHNHKANEYGSFIRKLIITSLL